MDIKVGFSNQKDGENEVFETSKANQILIVL